MQTLDDIVRNSVDLHVVDVEGGMAYQHTNYGWFQIAKKHLIAAKLKPSIVFQRVDAMPDFVGYGTGPDLHPVPFGDSDRLALRMLPAPSSIGWPLREREGRRPLMSTVPMPPDTYSPERRGTSRPTKLKSSTRFATARM